jgi:hypothetical protein
MVATCCYSNVNIMRQPLQTTGLCRHVMHVDKLQHFASVHQWAAENHCALQDNNHTIYMQGGLATLSAAG